MRITVDGEPIDDPAAQLVRRPALHRRRARRREIRFRFDNLASRPRLGVAAHPGPCRHRRGDDAVAPPVRFRMYANYCQLHRPRRSPDLRQPSSRRDSRAARDHRGRRGRACASGSRLRGVSRPGARAQVRAARVDDEGQFRRDRAAAAVAVSRDRARGGGCPATPEQKARRPAAPRQPARAARGLRRERARDAATFRSAAAR